MQQTASIAEREKLLAQIEEHKVLMEKEQTNEYTKKKLRQQEILDQVTIYIHVLNTLVLHYLPSAKGI